MSTVRRRTTFVLKWTKKIDHKVENTAKYAQRIDDRSRKNNIIIDQLIESRNEDTLAVVNHILNHALSIDGRSEIIVGMAYRIGVKTSDLNFNRNVFVKLTTTRGKDDDHARKITRGGNDGRPYYLTDDIPMSIKRKCADVHKYIKYLEHQKGQQDRKT